MRMNIQNETREEVSFGHVYDILERFYCYRYQASIQMI